MTFGTIAKTENERVARERLPISSSSGMRIVIVADDLTGACDSGIAFLRAGRTVRVLLNPGEDAGAARSPEFRSSEIPNEVWSISTETRNMSSEDASRHVGELVARLPARPDLLFKKVDSAGRGHLGAEVMSALEASGADLALVAPAFPQAGRVVRDGILQVVDFSGQDNSISLREMFPDDARHSVDVLRDDTVETLRDGLATAVNRGTRVLLCSASLQQHLEALVEAAHDVDASILWVGSAGLAHALAGQLAGSSNEVPKLKLRGGGRALLFVGTPHAVTKLQVSLLNDREHSRLIVACGQTPEHEVRSAFASASPAALILTGGDTAAFVLRALQAQSIVLQGQVALGIPWGIIQGGLADGCTVVTKSGGFGDPDALVQAFQFCEGSGCEST